MTPVAQVQIGSTIFGRHTARGGDIGHRGQHIEIRQRGGLARPPVDRKLHCRTVQTRGPWLFFGAKDLLCDFQFFGNVTFGVFECLLRM